MTFPLIKVVRPLLEADEYAHLFASTIQLCADIFPEFVSGIISKRDDKYVLNAAYPVKEWKHFPIVIEQDLSVIATDCFFKEIEIDLPEIKKNRYVFYPLEPAARDQLRIEGWFFINATMSSAFEQQEDILLFVDILREAVKKINKIEKIKELTIIDDVTGLYNTRHLYSVLESAVLQSGRYFAEFSLIFFDIDHFKSVNDTHGHLVGSKLLKELGQLIKNYLRKVDLAFRYGGDEFVVYLPFTPKNNAKNVIERLWDTIRSHEFIIDGVKLKITASYGLSGFPDDGKTVKEIVDKADVAMYNVKKRSRDSIEFAQ